MMKNVDIVTGRCIEAAEMAATITRDKHSHEGVIIELAVTPDGIEVRGVKSYNGEIINHAGARVCWETLRNRVTKDHLSSAVLEIASELSSTGKGKYCVY